MDSIDWLEQLHREAWTARIRQLRRELREEKEQVQTQFLPPHPVEQSSLQQRQRATRQSRSAT